MPVEGDPARSGIVSRLTTPVLNLNLSSRRRRISLLHARHNKINIQKVSSGQVIAANSEYPAFPLIKPSLRRLQKLILSLLFHYHNISFSDRNPLQCKFSLFFLSPQHSNDPLEWKCSLPPAIGWLEHSFMTTSLDNVTHDINREWNSS